MLVMDMIVNVMLDHDVGVCFNEIVDAIPVSLKG